MTRQRSHQICHRPGLARDERGATAIEYALLAAVVAIMAIAGLQALGGGAGGLYQTLDAITAAIAATIGS